MIGSLLLADRSIIFQVGREMKKIAGVLRICSGKKWGEVGMEI